MRDEGCSAHAGLVKGIENLERWQESQNGHLAGLRQEVNDMRREYGQNHVNAHRLAVAQIAGLAVALLLLLLRG